MMIEYSGWEQTHKQLLAANSQPKFTTKFTEDGQVVVASGTTFLSACHFHCLLIFGYSIHRSCKGVVLAKRWLNKFYYFNWIVVYIKIEVQLNVPLCANYLGGKYWVVSSWSPVECTWEASSSSPDGVSSILVEPVPGLS